ncbi:MAG TPA: hypothetical protein VGD58_31810 [Herpetosiphonaceae bacterium]
MQRWKYVSLVLVCLVIAALIPITSSYAAPRCFPETGQCLDGRFREYWDQSGGLPVFGFPITPEQDEQNRDTGQTYRTQWLERNRFELHLENAAPYDVLLGRLGDDRLRQQGRDWQTFPKADPGAAHYFAQTGHAIAHEPFWRYWSTRGLELGDRGVSERESLALFGLPLSEPQVETNSSGDTVLTQWFERARFEDHGANGVLLGLLGNEVRAGAGPSPSPSPSPSGSPSPSPSASPSPSPSQPPTFDGCEDDDGAKNAPNFPVRIVTVNKVTEVVRLQNVSTAPVDLNGWRMCSFRGAQEHPGIGGTLAPNETRDFPNTGDNIWNNNDSDDGGLYNASGQAISYWDDEDD